MANLFGDGIILVIAGGWQLRGYVVLCQRIMEDI